jgi:hypothetical protein
MVVLAPKLLRRDLVEAQYGQYDLEKTTVGGQRWVLRGVGVCHVPTGLLSMYC